MWQVLPSRMNCSVHFCFLLQTLHKLKDGFTLLAIFSMLNSSVVEIAEKIKEEMIKKRRDRQRGREKRVRYTEILSFSADRQDSFESLFIISLCSSSFPLCSIYMLLLRLIQPSGCLLHFVTSQPGDGTLGWWGRFFFPSSFSISLPPSQSLLCSLKRWLHQSLQHRSNKAGSPAMAKLGEPTPQPSIWARSIKGMLIEKAGVGVSLFYTFKKCNQ